MTSFSVDDNAPEWNLEKLFGRERESQKIRELADESSTNILVLRGHAGSGKSYLIENQPWDDRGWVYASGKYEQRRSNEPYSALISALNDLVDQWAVHNSTQSVCQMGAFQHLLDEDVIFLKRILPKAFTLSHGECGTVKKGKRQSGKAIAVSGGAEFINASFWRILSFLCKPKPVVMFLDDIHWADQASLDAIQVLATSGEVEGLFLVLAYRVEEVQSGSTVSKCLDSIYEGGFGPAHDMFVFDLDLDNVNQLISHLLLQDAERTKELAKVIHHKTMGNPFFVMQFLQMLRQNRFLTYSLMSLQWEWGDVDKIRGISDNVADIVASTLQKLPLSTQVALKASSCLGKLVPLEVMVKFFDTIKLDPDCQPMVCEALRSMRVSGLKQVLDDAVEVGILIRSDDGEIYMWAHDKIQQCAYMMIPDDFKPIAHGNLGQVLWKMSASSPDDEWMLYMAADQMNRSFCDKDKSFAEDIARLSYEAAKVSIDKSAFIPAFEMVQGAAKRLDAMEDPWEKTYDLALNVYSSVAEVGVRLGRYEIVEEVVEKVLKNAKTLEDKFRAQEVLVRCRVSGKNRDYVQGIDLVQGILLEYGVKFPDKLLPGQLFMETKKLKARLGGDLEGLMNLRRLDEDNEEDKKHIHIITMLTDLSFFAYFTTVKRQLGYYAAIRALNTSIKHGLCAYTALAISCIAKAMNLESHHQEAFEFANFATKLVDSFPLELGSPHPLIHASVTAGIMSSVLPFNKTLDSWLEVNKLGLKIGDTERAAMGLIGYTYAYICVGLSLEPLGRDLLSFKKESQLFGMPETMKILFPILHQFILNLTIDVTDPTMLKGESFNEANDLKAFSGLGLDMTKRDINSFKLMLACIFRKWDVAADLICELEAYIGNDQFSPRQHHRSTYMGIASIILSRRAGKRKSRFRQIGKRIVKLFKDQIKNGSQNALPVVLMLEAVEAPSKEKFDYAIRTTARLGLRQHQAMLYEQAGLFFLEAGDEGWGEYYLSHACNLYRDWGATAKAVAMRREHHSLMKSSSLMSAPSSSLQGRSRYTPEYSKQVSEVDWCSSTSLQTSQRSFGHNSSSDVLGKPEESDGAEVFPLSP